ncbi:MAG: ABC transporter permease subunit [Oscillospiraceae bacterium]
MSKLLSANLNRLMKDKIFILFTAGIFLFSSYVMLCSVYADIKYDADNTLDYRYYDVLPYAGIIISAFVALFIGTEHGDGTMHNKIAVGHTRRDIYFADIITCSVAAAVFMAAWALGGMLGIPHFGIWSTGIRSYLVTMAVAYLSALALMAIFSILAHSIQSRAAGAVAAIFLAIFIMYGGSYFYNSLSEPETTYEYIRITDEKVEYGDEIRNPAYVGGSKRMVYEVLSNVFPTGQQIRIADNYGEIENPVFMILCSAGMIVISVAAGYLLFRKKDLR